MTTPARRTPSTAAALGVALLLAGCGTQTSTSSTTTTSAVVSTGAATPAPGTTTVTPPTGVATSPASSGTTTSGAASSTAPPTSAGAASPAGSSAPASPTSASVPAGGQAPTAIRAATEAVYLVGQDGDSGLRLFREFTAVPAGAAAGTAADVRATRAVAAAMASGAPYRPLWGERNVASVRRDKDGIVVTLAPGALPRLDRGQGRLALASLVWTATAAYQADVPVRVVDPGRTTTVGGLPTTRPYRRADSQDLLAGIWVDAPAMGGTVPAGRVVARGQASVWEANVVWSLTRGGARVRDGVTTATIGAPARGAWTVDLGRLAPGSYTLTLRAPSPKEDGGDMARAVRTVTVR